LLSYLVMTWSRGDQRAQALARRELDRLEQQEGWRRRVEESGLAVALPPNQAPRLRRLMNGRGVILGDVFPCALDLTVQDDWLALSPDPGSSEALCRRLTTDSWGRYVVVHQAGSNTAPMVFRDPSGALDALIWSRGGLSFLAGALSPPMIPALPPDLAVDWPAVGDILLDPALIGARIALRGVRSVAPGELAGADGRSAAMLWTPAKQLRRDRKPLDVAKAELAEIVDRCVAAYAGQAGRILAEVSGGLDSAIVASALRAAAPDKVVQWLNYHVAESQGDERVFARAVAGALGLALTEAAKPELTLTEGGLAALPFGARPSIDGLDAHYDADMAERCRTLGVDTILTGQGGDTVFFQMRTPLVAADALWRGLPPRELGAILLGVARWTRTSVWSVARVALLAGFRRRWELPFKPPAYLSPALSPQGRAAAGHPWLADLDRAPPAKRLQIHALAGAQLFHGASRRGEVADVIHPLLSQPVVEYGLGLLSFDQTLGQRDRALARAAFAARLPVAVVRRRSKGDLTAYYGRMLTRSVNVLRPFLLDGALVRERLVVRPTLEAMLTPDALIEQASYPDILELIAIEAWARRWDSLSRDRAGP
jgi:asparagine synthase (glutamine-hydrolysing)